MQFLKMMQWVLVVCLMSLFRVNAAGPAINVKEELDSSNVIPKVIVDSLDTVHTIAAPVSNALNDSTEKKPLAAPEELMIEVDPKLSKNANKSLPLALAMSAFLPGAGEIYLSDQGHAKIFLLAEVGFWASLYVAFVAQESYLQSARNYASEYAGIDASEKGEGFLNAMSNYRSYLEKQHRQDSYEITQILSGKRNQDYDIPMSSDNFWDFGSSINPQNTANWQTFQSTLRYYRASKVAISFAIGALALNRILSIANTLHVYKHTSVHSLSLEMTPEIGPNYTGGRLSLSF